MIERSYNVLFLCTANSARSIIAESILNQNGQSFRGYSAGSHPSGRVNPLAIELLRGAHMPVDGLFSKSWEAFEQSGAPVMDFVITVCDNAAGEVCPIWPGRPITAHWGVPDPAAVLGAPDEQRRAFRNVFHTLLGRIRLFTSLPIDKLDRLTLENNVRDIGRTA